MNCFKLFVDDDGEDYSNQNRGKQPQFMCCIIRVDTDRSRWHKHVHKVLKSIHGMRHCVIEKDGLLEVSGFVDPDLLVKALGKAKSKMELKWLQFGKCSTNLFGPDRRQFMMIQPAAPPPPVITPAPPSPLQATGFGYPPGARYPYRHDGRLYGSDIHPYYDGNEGCHIM